MKAVASQMKCLTHNKPAGSQAFFANCGAVTIAESSAKKKLLTVCDRWM
jgi:hypothetical protein